MRRGLAVAVGKLDKRSDQQGFALKPCLRMLEDAMEPRETVGECCVADDCMREERRRYASPRCLFNCCGKHGAVDIDHAIRIAAIVSGWTAVMSDVGIDDDAASRNGSPQLATRREGMRAGLDDAERVALVGMPCIAMGAGVRPQEIHATEPVKPPIARRH